MDFSRKVVILLICFSCTAVLVAYSPFSENSGTYSANGRTKILTIDGWQGKSIVTSQAVLDTLQATTTVFSDYFRDSSTAVNLYVGYYDSLAKAKMSHAPQVCFTAQGWIMKKNDKVDIRLNGAVQKINRLLLEKDRERLLVYYWYQNEEDIYADLFWMKLNLLRKKLIQGKHFNGGNAFVRISTSLNQDKKRAPDILQEFADKVVKELPKNFNTRFSPG